MKLCVRAARFCRCRLIESLLSRRQSGDELGLLFKWASAWLLVCSTMATQPMILFYEATANIDSETEEVIQVAG